jgi:VanZ family protein
MPSASPPAATPSAAARWTPPVLWLALILVGTSWPSISVGPDDLGLDKVAHFKAYTVLAALCLRSTRRPREWSTVFAVIASVALLGAVDEWHQSFIPGRSMSLFDWCADALGATVGAMSVRLIPFLTPRRSLPT